MGNLPLFTYIIYLCMLLLLFIPLQKPEIFWRILQLFSI